MNLKFRVKFFWITKLSEVDRALIIYMYLNEKPRLLSDMFYIKLLTQCKRIIIDSGYYEYLSLLKDELIVKDKNGKEFDMFKKI